MPVAASSRQNLPVRDTAPATLAFDLTDIVVRYGATVAVDSVSLRAEPGTLTALLGPNGAGKSSLLRVLSTAERPQSGQVRIFGHDVRTDPMAARARLGLVFQERTLDKESSVERNLRFHARLFGMSRRETAEQIDRLLDTFGLTERRRQVVERLSGGMARRVELVRALLHQPGLLVLDEPTTGLDPQSRATVWDDVRRLRDDLGVTTLYSTHYLDEAELADQIVIMSAGRVGRRGTPTELKARLATSRAVLSTGDDAGAAVRLRAAGFDAGFEDGRLAVRCTQPERQVARIVRALDSPVEIPVETVEVIHPRMDDVYLSVANDEGGERA